MKILLSICVAAVGLLGFASAPASAAEATVESMPAVVHVNQVVVVETGHRHYYHHRHWHHRRYYWRHHRRYYY